jgi:hypothetical protein
VVRDIVCLRNICVNTLHKGDSDDVIIIIIGFKMAGCKTDVYFRLVERLRIRGTVPPLPHVLPMLAQA